MLASAMPIRDKMKAKKRVENNKTTHRTFWSSEGKDKLDCALPSRDKIAAKRAGSIPALFVGKRRLERPTPTSRT